jgi:hypothetical protein
MLKDLAVMAVIGFGVGILSAQQIPADAPKQGVAESSGSSKGQKQPQAQSGDKSAPSPVAPTPKPTTPTCDESCQQGRENLKIQNRLTWLTGGLVMVGLLQVGGMIWQAVLLAKTRDEVHTQAGWMKTQTEHMGSQLAEIKRQADLMQRQIEIGINKERARLFVDRVETDLRCLVPGYQREMTEFPGMNPISTEIDRFAVSIQNEGITSAYNTFCYRYVTITSEDGSVLLKEEDSESIGVVKPSAKGIEGEISFFSGLNQEILDKIHDKSATLRFSGFVGYEDAFDPGLIHKSSFSFTWVVDDEWIDLGEHGGVSQDRSTWVKLPFDQNCMT